MKAYNHLHEIASKLDQVNELNDLIDNEVSDIELENKMISQKLSKYFSEDQIKIFKDDDMGDEEWTLDHNISIDSSTK